MLFQACKSYKPKVISNSCSRCDNSTAHVMTVFGIDHMLSSKLRSMCLLHHLYKVCLLILRKFIFRVDMLNSMGVCIINVTFFPYPYIVKSRSSSMSTTSIVVYVYNVCIVHICQQPQGHLRCPRLRISIISVTHTSTPGSTS